jgi:hypothetical protein
VRKCKEDTVLGEENKEGYLDKKGIFRKDK